jgi:hypothetical protein
MSKVEKKSIEEQRITANGPYTLALEHVIIDLLAKKAIDQKTVDFIVSRMAPHVSPSVYKEVNNALKKDGHVSLLCVDIDSISRKDVPNAALTENGDELAKPSLEEKLNSLNERKISFKATKKEDKVKAVLAMIHEYLKTHSVQELVDNVFLVYEKEIDSYITAFFKRTNKGGSVPKGYEFNRATLNLNKYDSAKKFNYVKENKIYHALKLIALNDDDSNCDNDELIHKIQDHSQILLEFFAQLKSKTSPTPSESNNIIQRVKKPIVIDEEPDENKEEDDDDEVEVEIPKKKEKKSKKSSKN